MVKHWSASFPFLYQEFSKGNVLRFDSAGISRELSKEQIEMKEKLEKEYDDLNVIAVIDSLYLLQNGSAIRFVDFVLLGKDEEPEIIDEDENVFSFLSYTQNVDDDHCSEMGYIGLRERGGLLKRVY